jgi:hypothetical protein
MVISGLFGKPLELDGLGLPTEDRYIEVLVWTQDADPASLSTATSEDAMAYLLYPIAPVINPQSMPTNFPVLRLHQIPMDPSQCLGDVVRFVEFREVIWMDNRTYLAGPTFTIAATSFPGMNALFGEAGCPDDLYIEGCFTGSGGAVVRHRTRRPGPPPNTQIQLPPLEIRVGQLESPQE